MTTSYKFLALCSLFLGMSPWLENHAEAKPTKRSPAKIRFTHDPCTSTGRFSPDSTSCQAKRAEMAVYNCCVVDERICNAQLEANSDIDTASEAFYKCGGNKNYFERKACANSGGHYISKAGSCMRWGS